MSDLDTDLYGDLYGDDNEFVIPTEPAKEPAKTETPAHTSPSVATAEEPASSKSASPPATSSGSLAFETPKPLTRLDSPPPQPIQTSYSNTNDYSQQRPIETVQYLQGDVAGQPIASSLSIVDRHIRPSEMKEEGKMFIGGLNWDTTDEGLRKYFEQFGKVEACTIMRDATGRSRCFAFLTFEDPASVNAVMVREHYLDGKIIDPKRAIPRQEHQRAQKLFIGGLAGSVTSDSMREYFSQYGKVIDSTVMLDRETGRSKGFGFVSFENTNVEPLLGFGKLEIDGKMIDVKLAQPRHARDGTGSTGGSYREGGYSSGGQTGGTYSDASSTSYPASTTASTTQTQGSTPFDPQALAALYTRMFQQFGGAAGMGMGGFGMGMGGMMGNGGMGGMGANFAGAAGMNGGGMGGASGMGRMGGGMGQMGIAGATQQGAMGRGLGGGGVGVISGPVNAPRGPRGATGGPQGVGPQRSAQRGHGYHPYSR